MGAAGLVFAGRVKDEDLVLPVSLLPLTKNEDAGRQAGAVEEVGAEADDGFEDVHLENLAADFALLGHAEQGAVRQDYPHAARGGDEAFRNNFFIMLVNFFADTCYTNILFIVEKTVSCIHL